MYQNNYTQLVETLGRPTRRKWLLRLLLTTFLICLLGLVGYGYQQGYYFADNMVSAGSIRSGQGTASTVENGISPVGGTDSFASTNNFARFGQEFDVQGRVVPVKKADLSTARGGVVASLHVEEGDYVTAGQLLVTLDSVNEEAEVLRAEARLQQVNADLQRLKNSVRPSDLLAAQASVDAAKARLAQLENGSLPGAVAAAEAQVAASEAARQRVLQGANPASIAAAQAELENAQKFRDDAQKAYDQVSWRNDVGTLPESANLQRATNAYNAARSRLDALTAGATAAESALANADLQRSQAQLNALSASLPSQIQEAEANVRLFEAQLLRLQEGVFPEEIAVAEAEIRAAHATLNQAQSVLTDMELRAPFDGVIAILDVAVGEYVTPSNSIVRIADTSEWEIETSNLTELDVLGITEGEQVSMTFDALPDETLGGVVKYVRPFGESVTQETFYKVVIIPEVHDSRFLWNMSSFITFDKHQTDESGS